MNEHLKAWVDSSKKLKIEQMSESLSRGFIQCSMAELEKATMQQGFYDDPWIKMISGRAEAIGLVISDYAKLFVRIMSENPGDIVMHLVLLRAQVRGEVTMENIAFIFPNGFLTQESKSKLWDAQKYLNGARDNFLDTLKPEDFH